MSIYNPASLRVREVGAGVDLNGIVTLVFPNGTVTPLNAGVVMVRLVAAGGIVAFEPTQDGTDPRKFVIPGTDNWVASSIRIYLNGQRLRTSLLTVTGSGNRTIYLDASVMAPDLAATPPDLVEGEGVKA